MTIKQQKATFCTYSAAVYSKDKLKDITTNSYWDTINEKDRGQETNNPHIIARRLITKGGLTDAKLINLVLSQQGHSINQCSESLELDKLSSIKPVSILFDDLGVQTNTHEQIISSSSSSAYNAKVRSKLNRYIGGTSTSIAGVYIWTNLKTGEQYVGRSESLLSNFIKD